MGSTYFTWAILGWLYSDDKPEKAENARQVVIAAEAPYAWAYTSIFVFLITCIAALIIGFAFAGIEKKTKSEKIVAWFCLAWFVISIFGMGISYDYYVEYLNEWRRVL